MQKRTLQQVIDDAKAGKSLDDKECRDTMIALYSMLAKSRMIIETIADKSGNAESLYYTTHAFIGNLDTVMKERADWMNSVPSQWLVDQDLLEREKIMFYDQFKT